MGVHANRLVLTPLQPTPPTEHARTDASAGNRTAASPVACCRESWGISTLLAMSLLLCLRCPRAGCCWVLGLAAASNSRRSLLQRAAPSCRATGHSKSRASGVEQHRQETQACCQNKPGLVQLPLAAHPVRCARCKQTKGAAPPPVVGCLVLYEQLCCLWVGWAGAVGVCQHALYRHQHAVHVVAGRPLVLKRVHADVAVRIHLRLTGKKEQPAQQQVSMQLPGGCTGPLLQLPQPIPCPARRCRRQRPHVGVEHLACESDAGRLRRVVLSELQLEREDAALRRVQVVQQRQRDCRQNTGQAGCLCVELYGLGAGSPQQLLGMSMRVALLLHNQPVFHSPPKGSPAWPRQHTCSRSQHRPANIHSAVVRAIKHADQTRPETRRCARSSAAFNSSA